MRILVLNIYQLDDSGYCALQVSCPVERVIDRGSQVLNSVMLQVTEAVSLYSDRDRCHSLAFSRQLTCKAQYCCLLYWKVLAALPQCSSCGHTHNHVLA